MMRAILLAVAVCVVAGALEGIFAGRGIKQRFRELRMPRFSPSLSLWIVIGAAYYLMCGVVLYRLFSQPFDAWRKFALALMSAVLLLNAFWNYAFFRRRSLHMSFQIGMIYSVVAVALLCVLWRADAVAAWCFLPYCVYLIYAFVWSAALMRANSAPPEAL